MEKQIVVFLGILDWGLGHATRSIALIKALQANGMKVIAGGSGVSLELIRQAFPEILTITLPPTNIRYAARSARMGWKILIQLPRLLRVFLQERRQIRRICQAYGVQAIISDHRYGIRYKGTPSVLLIHQIRLSPPAPFGFAAVHVNAFHRCLIQKFDEVWIPDTDSRVLSGKLSEVDLQHIRHVGALSRFEGWSVSEGKLDYDLCAILSGPEPQRSMLEEQFIQQASRMPGRFALVRGWPGMDCMLHSSGNLNVFDHLESAALQGLIQRSEVVLCRSGYSSIMDLAGSGKPVIMIPTPGQPEQEYLAAHLSQAGYGLKVNQSSLDLPRNLLEVHQQQPIPAASDAHQLDLAIQNLGYLIKNDQIRGSSEEDIH